MERSTQLEFLKGKFTELSSQYLAALNDGDSLQQIKDLSYVLDCIKQEIEMLEKELENQKVVPIKNSYKRRALQHPKII